MFQGIKKTCKDGKDMRYVISQPLDYQMFQTPNTQSRFHQPIVSWNCCTLTPMSMWKTMKNPPKVQKNTNIGGGSLPPISYIHLWFDILFLVELGVVHPWVYKIPGPARGLQGFLGHRLVARLGQKPTRLEGSSQDLWIYSIPKEIERLGTTILNLC